MQFSASRLYFRFAGPAPEGHDAGPGEEEGRGGGSSSGS